MWNDVGVEDTTEIYTVIGLINQCCVTVADVCTRIKLFEQKYFLFQGPGPPGGRLEIALNFGYDAPQDSYRLCSFGVSAGPDLHQATNLCIDKGHDFAQSHGTDTIYAIVHDEQPPEQKQMLLIAEQSPKVDVTFVHNDDQMSLYKFVFP